MFLIKMHQHMRLQVDMKTTNQNPGSRMVYLIQLSRKSLLL